MKKTSFRSLVALGVALFSFLTFSVAPAATLIQDFYTAYPAIISTNAATTNGSFASQTITNALNTTGATFALKPANLNPVATKGSLYVSYTPVGDNLVASNAPSLTLYLYRKLLATAASAAETVAITNFTLPCTNGVTLTKFYTLHSGFFGDGVGGVQVKFAWVLGNTNALGTNSVDIDAMRLLSN